MCEPAFPVGADARPRVVPGGLGGGLGSVPTRSLSQLQAQIAQLHEQLIESQRLACAGTTAAMLAHEYNNLMTPILARSIDALQRDDVEAMRLTLERTISQVRKTIALSRHLLQIVDPDDKADEACTVAAAVNEAIAETIRPFDKDGIELVLDIPETLRVRGRALLLEQVLLNLLLNARRALKGMRGRITVAALRAGEMVEIRVADTGVGIPAEQVEHVFNPFFSRDAEQDHGRWREAGLGLHVCRLIAQRHHATLRVAANVPRGCVFTLKWPAA